ncbi:MAG: methyl-accepting chemotaxis protein [Lachnospiraceae bacterium]|nr:methyl-accepting chemotaxis protein [Lachnospiraceae bacterium]
MKGLFSVNPKELKNLSVEEKFKVVFRKIVLGAFISIAALVLTIAMSYAGIMAVKKSAAVDNVQGEIRIDIQALSKAFLWAMASPDESIRQEQLGKAMDKFAEFDANLAKFSKIYSNQTLLNQVSTDLKKVEANGEELGNLFNSGADSEEAFYYFNDTLYPSIDVVVQDLKAVSKETTASSDQVYRSILISVWVMIAIVAVIIFFIMRFIVVARKVLTDSILIPVQEISAAADSMAKGNMNIHLDYDADDELGKLAKDLDYSTTVVEEVVSDMSNSLDRIAGGDFTVATEHPELYVEDFAPIKEAVEKIVTQLSQTISNVMEASSRVAQGAANMSEGASDLAEGTTDQAAAVEQLTASVVSVNNQTKEMAESARKGVNLAQQVRKDAAESAEKMQEVTKAMESITEASKEIEQVTNAIEGIAKQTQLLALNASIEAARAGETGKGFAVVADEISALANESSEAAKSTHELINSTLQTIQNGNKVVDMTTEALNQVQESVNNIAIIVQESGEMAESQAKNMEEINNGIEQISSVVQNNSATAEESSAVSVELSTQSEELNRLVSQFKV